MRESSKTERSPLPQSLDVNHPPHLDAESFYRKYPVEPFIRSIEARKRPWILGIPGLATTAALLVIVVSGIWGANLLDDSKPIGGPAAPGGNGAFGTNGIISMKGLDHPDTSQLIPLEMPAELTIIRETDQDEVVPGEILHANEILRMYYTSLDHDYIFVFSVDEVGQMSQYYPAEGLTSMPIARGRRIPLPDRIILDDYVGKERFFALFSNEALDARDVREAVNTRLNQLGRTGKDLSLLKSLSLDAQLSTIWIQKR